MRENNFVILFSSIRKKIYKLLNSKLKNFNISIIEALYLIIISDEEYISFKELTRKADCDKGMTTKVLVKLKMMGFVTYDTKNISITNKGLDVSNEIKDILKEIRDRLSNKIGKEKLNNIYEELSEFNNILEGEIKC